MGSKDSLVSVREVLGRWPWRLLLGRRASRELAADADFGSSKKLLNGGSWAVDGAGEKSLLLAQGATWYKGAVGKGGRPGWGI